MRQYLQTIPQGITTLSGCFFYTNQRLPLVTDAPGNNRQRINILPPG
jgi:hypothetical protein